jgi:hypothetical protein
VAGGGAGGGDVTKEDEEEVARRRKMETMKMTDFLFRLWLLISPPSCHEIHLYL